MAHDRQAEAEQKWLMAARLKQKKNGLWPPGRSRIKLAYGRQAEAEQKWLMATRRKPNKNGSWPPDKSGSWSRGLQIEIEQK